VWVTSFYGYDGHGSVRYLTDSNGNVTATYDYDAFGNLISRTGYTPNAYFYCGEQYDSDLGLYYNRARYLNTDSGRFWTRDLWEEWSYDPPTFNGYAYVRGDPANRIDPSGLSDANLPSQQMATGIQGTMARSVLRYTTRAGKQVAKVIACGTWVVVFRQAVLEESELLGLHGHHRKPLVFGGPQDQVLAYLDATLHRSFHKAINAFLQMDGLLPENIGRDEWRKLLSNPQTLRGVYEAHIKAARYIDRVCKLKGPLSLEWFTSQAWRSYGGIPKR